MALKLKDIQNNRKEELMADAPKLLESIYAFCSWCPCRAVKEVKGGNVKLTDKKVDICYGYDNPDRARFLGTEPCEFKVWFDKYKFVFPIECRR